MNKQTKVHDGIIGLCIVVLAFIGWTMHANFLIVLIFLGLLMIQSAFTGYCPLHWAINKFVK